MFKRLINKLNGMLAVKKYKERLLSGKDYMIMETSDRKVIKIDSIAQKLLYQYFHFVELPAEFILKEIEAAERKYLNREMQNYLDKVKEGALKGEYMALFQDEYCLKTLLDNQYLSLDKYDPEEDFVCGVYYMPLLEGNKLYSVDAGYLKLKVEDILCKIEYEKEAVSRLDLDNLHNSGYLYDIQKALADIEIFTPTSTVISLVDGSINELRTKKDNRPLEYSQHYYLLARMAKSLSINGKFEYKHDEEALVIPLIETFLKETYQYSKMYGLLKVVLAENRSLIKLILN